MGRKATKTFRIGDTNLPTSSKLEIKIKKYVIKIFFEENLSPLELLVKGLLLPYNIKK